MKRTIDRVTTGYPRIKVRESRVKIGYHLQILEKVSRDIILWVLSAAWLVRKWEGALRGPDNSEGEEDYRANWKPAIRRGQGRGEGWDSGKRWWSPKGSR